MQILEDLWRGQIYPMEHTAHGDEDYRELAELWERNEQKLLPTLNAMQQEDFRKIRDLWEEMGQISECRAFITGFRLAMQLMTASM